MTLALFFIEQETGGFIARCETFPRWRFIGGDLRPETKRAAEDSLREFIAADLSLAKYLVPLANRDLAMIA